MTSWLHRILNVPEDAPEKELRAGFAAQLREFHPDRCPDTPENRQRLELARLAYDVLRDPKQREEHEKTGRISEEREISECLRENLSEAGLLQLARGFIQAFQRERPVDGKNRYIRISLSVGDLIKGSSRIVDVRRTVACGRCNGSGSEKKPPSRRCHVCDATGTISWRGSLARGMRCAFCYGKGIIVRSPCKDCRGEAYECQEQPFRVTIPPGVPEGHRVVLAGEGERGERGGRHGDMILLLHMDESSLYKREGANLLVEKEFAPGSESIQLDHPDGPIKVPVPDGFESGTLVATGFGLPVAADPTQRGDLRIQLKTTKASFEDGKEKPAGKEL